MHRDMEDTKEEETDINVDMRNINSNAGIQEDSYRREIQNLRRKASYSDNKIQYNRDCVSAKRGYMNSSIKLIYLLSTNTLRNAVRRRNLLFLRNSNWWGWRLIEKLYNYHFKRCNGLF